MKIVLFFSYGISLKAWEDTGLLQREKLIYEWLIDQRECETVYWVTYGTNDEPLAEDLYARSQLSSKIKVLAMPRFFDNKMGRLLYSFCIPWIHKEKLKNVDLYKTNQLEGSWAAVLAKKFFKKPLLVRCGYVWSLFAKRQRHRRQLDSVVNIAEKFAYKNADFSIVSHEEAKNYILDRYHIPRDKVAVIHNFVDTAKFHQMPEIQKGPDRFVFVGRLHPQKNLSNLVRAFSEMSLGLDIYGKGEEETSLRKLVEETNADVLFKGIVNNADLPVVLNRYSYFILPSLYEGMPKSLLEAMACGLVCVGTDTPGIREIITDGKDGYLIPGTESSCIREYILKIKSQPLENISRNAIKKVQDNYALDVIAIKEERVISFIGRKEGS